MKVLVFLLLFTVYLQSCSKDTADGTLKGTFVDLNTKRDTIIFSNEVFPDDFSYKPYRWQDSALTHTYFFHCRSYLKTDTIAILSWLSSSTFYRMVYFRPEAGNNSFVIDSFYDWINPYRKRTFIRI